MNDVIEFLKEYILSNGFDRLSDKPFDVYRSMVTSNVGNHGIDQRTARLVLVTLMSMTHEKAEEGCSVEELANHIQSEHCVNEKTADELAAMYLELFSDENQQSWEEAKEAGFKEFCEGEWTVEWEGTCDWHIKHGGSYPCSAEASLTFAVRDKEQLHNHLSSDLEANPFLSSDDIYHILMWQIEADLDDDMDEFCNADDYYEPYFEEFVGDGTYDSEAKWKSWGLDIIEFTGSGDIDYEI